MVENSYPWFPFYPKDWLASATVRAMTNAQRGIYIELLAHCWNSGDCSIRDDIEYLTRVACSGEQVLNGCSTDVQHVLEQAFVAHPNKAGYITNSRLLSHWSDKRKMSKKKSEAGKASGKARKNRGQTNNEDPEHPLNTCSTPVEQNANKTGTEGEQNRTNHSYSHSINTGACSAHASCSDSSEPLSSLEGDNTPLFYSKNEVGEARANTKAQEEKTTKKRVSYAGDINKVIAHYQTYHPKAKPGDKEKTLIRSRLKDGYDLEELCAAIDGNHRSPFHCGENDRNETYHSLALIFRNSDYVNKFISIPEKQIRTTQRESRTIAAGQSWLEKQVETDNES